MRTLASLLLVLIVTGFAPVTVALGFCADSPCCQQSGEIEITMECCGDVVCSEEEAGEQPPPQQLVKTIAPAPAAAEEMRFAPPAPTRVAAVVLLVPATTPERLSILSILLI